MNKEEWLKKGYVTEPVDKTLDLKTEIDKLRKEKNALILGHYYQSGEIHNLLLALFLQSHAFSQSLQHLIHLDRL